MIFQFPRDIHNRIVSKLDIDTRRSLGIYVKLKVPESLINKLTNVYKQTIYCHRVNDGYGTNGISYGICLDFKIFETSNYIFTKGLSIVHHTFNEGTLYYVYQTYMNERKDKQRFSHVLNDINLDNDDDRKMFDNMDRDFFNLYYGYKDGKLREYDNNQDSTEYLFKE